MGMVHTVGLVLHPRRDSSTAIETIIGWAREREVTVLGLHDEVDRIDCSAVAAVIVSTPTGSTAYSFSVGGPIVSPTVEGLIVGAAAAHSSFNRSLLLSLDEQLDLDVLRSSGRLAVEVDGIVRGYVTAGDT